MALVNSLGGGIARKSVDNKTFRMVRGRIVVSRKRTATGNAATRGDGFVLSKQQAVFGMVSMFMQAHASDIEVSFNKTKYGSQRNYFFKKNRAALEAALAPLVANAMLNGYPMLADIEDAITTYATANPNAILRVSLTGFSNVFLDGAWSSNDNPVSGGSSTNDIGKGDVESSADGYTYTAPCATSIMFHAGAKIVRPASNVLISCAGLPADVAVDDIKFLTNNGNVVPGLAATSVVSSSNGSLRYSAPAITEAQNVVGVSVANVFVRLTSAYVKTADDNPLG